MNSYKYSIIIPVYNSEKYIKRCIESIIYQTYKNIEIILVNDGSTDDTYKICLDFYKKDERIKLINKENGGVSSSRNKGLEVATGDFVTFLDSDDFFNLDAIEIFNNVCNINKEDLYIFQIISIKNGIESLDNCNIEQGSYRLIEFFNLFLKNPNYLERINSVCSKLYRLDIIKSENIKFEEDIKIGEDLLFNINYLKHTNKIYWHKGALYNYYTDNSSSATKKYMPYKYLQLSKVNGEFKDFLDSIIKDSKTYNKNIVNLYKYIKIKNIYSCIIDLFHKSCTLTYKQKIKCIKQMKNNEGKSLVKKMGIQYFILSFIFSFFPSNFLLILGKVLFILKKGKYAK